MSRSRRAAFLSMEDPEGFVIDDALAVEPLAALGWEVDTVPWNRPGVDWSRFEIVVVRSPWDYQNHLDRFLALLETIDASSARLENDLELMRWNLDKGYLRDLEARGVAIAPTEWRERLDPGELAGLFDRVAALGAAGEIVVKPRVSANADGAFRLDRATATARAEELERYYADRPLLAQPFAPAVLDEGEYSLFYFDGAFSHAISKVPKAGDFRVQEEHGGDIRPAQPEHELARAGRRAMAAIDARPLYARADFVRSISGDGFWLMELELVEPALYLRMDPGAPERFARAVDRRVTEVRSGAGAVG